jgi:hypothetical protein
MQCYGSVTFADPYLWLTDPDTDPDPYPDPGRNPYPIAVSFPYLMQPEFKSLILPCSLLNHITYINPNPGGLVANTGMTSKTQNCCDKFIIHQQKC